MPTVKRMSGARIVIYPNDHGPAHVHVVAAGSEAVFDLNCPNGPPAIRHNHGFSLQRVRRLALELAACVAELCEAWSDIHERQ